MAVSRARREDIPKDAVILTEDEALHIQWKTITEWENMSEVWALRFGAGIIASMSGVTALFINNHYRVKLRLGTYGRFSTYLPIIAVPTMFSLICHKVFVQRKLLLDPMEQCPLCLQMRAAIIQSGLGVVYPTILAPFSALMFATRHFTYRLPSLTENPKEVLLLLKKFTKPIVPTLTTIFLGQSLITIYLTYKQQQQSLRVIINMKMVEQKIEQDMKLKET